MEQWTTNGHCEQKDGDSKKSRKERLEMKNTNEKNDFDEFISRLVPGRLNELQ